MQSVSSRIWTRVAVYLQVEPSSNVDIGSSLTGIRTKVELMQKSKCITSFFMFMFQIKFWKKW